MIPEQRVVEFLASPPMLRFTEEEWPASVRDELQACPKLPARQQIKAIEAHLRSGGMEDAFKYVNKQKEKASEPKNNKIAEVPFWEAFLKWFSPEYTRGGLRAELEKRLQEAGLLTNDKKQDRELRWQCVQLLAAGLVQTWCAHCNYLDKKQNRGFRSEEEGD